MMQDLFRHRLDYSVLAVMAGSFIFYFIGNRTNPRSLVLSTIAFAAAYLIWGIWHHLRVKNLTRHIVLEYFLVSALGIVIVSSLLL